MPRLRRRPTSDRGTAPYRGANSGLAASGIRRVPTTAYLPLLALLRRRTTDDEVTDVARALLTDAGEGGDVSSIDARVLMSKVPNDVPSDTDLARVEAQVADEGDLLTDLAVQRCGGALPWCVISAWPPRSLQ
ncbi:MAG: DUF3349 domain-containing protein [Cumulibacter sp.]